MTLDQAIETVKSVLDNQKLTLQEHGILTKAFNIICDEARKNNDNEKK